MKQKMLIPALTLILGIAAGAIGGRMTAEPGDPGKTREAEKQLDEASMALYEEIMVMQKDICIKQAKRDLLCYDCGIVESSPEMYISKRMLKIEIDCNKILHGRP